MRVCYAWFPVAATVLLLLAYTKNEQENLTADDKKAVRELVRQFEAGLRR